MKDQVSMRDVVLLVVAVLCGLVFALGVVPGMADEGVTNFTRVEVSEGFDGVLGGENIMLPSVIKKDITFTAAAGGSGTVATIAAGEIWIIHDVLIEVTTNFDCTGDDTTLVVGDGNDADGFLVLIDADLQATTTEGTGFSAGWSGQDDDNTGLYLDETDVGFVYDEAAAETIDYLIDETSGETITAGAATIYVVYTRIQ